MSGDGKPFAGKVAVVTGAGGDIGGAAAVMFAEKGAAVVAVDRDAAALAALAARMPPGARLLPQTADVASEGDVARYVRDTKAAFGRIDCFFNNAGIEGSRSGAWALIPDLALADFDEIIAVNARGVFLGLKHVIPVIAASGGGAVVNTSSINGLKGARGQVAYVASKHAVSAMTVVAAREWARLGVRVNAIAPGGVEGRMLRTFFPIVAANSRSADAGKPPRHNPAPFDRLADPREIAAVAAFLCSDDAAYMTGATYPVDGGLLAN